MVIVLNSEVKDFKKKTNLVVSEDLCLSKQI